MLCVCLCVSVEVSIKSIQFKTNQKVQIGDVVEYSTRVEVSAIKKKWILVNLVFYYRTWIFNSQLQMQSLLIPFYAHQIALSTMDEPSIES